jgi:hypothetical protein
VSNSRGSGLEHLDSSPANVEQRQRARVSNSRGSGLEHLDSSPANVKDHSAFPDEYWELFNPLDDDDSVAMDSA